MVLLGFIDEPKGGKTGADDDPSNWTISRIGGQAVSSFERTTANRSDDLGLSLGKHREQSEIIARLCQMPTRTDVCLSTLLSIARPSIRSSTLSVRLSKSFVLEHNAKVCSSFLLTQLVHPQIDSSWTAVRCQKFDEFVEESISSDEEETPPASVPPSSKDWGDDADAWNTDEDDNQDAVVQTKSTKKKAIKIEPEVKLESMKIADDDQEDAAKSSSDEDEIDLDSKKKSQGKNVSVASSDAFNEWKRHNLQQATAELTGQDQFPFYYIDIDEEEAIVNDAKLVEQKKLKKKCQQIDEDDGDDEDTTKRGKE